MQLTIDGQSRMLIPIAAFQQQQNLPPSFLLSQFEPKDFAGLGSVERAGNELNDMKSALKQMVPANMLALDVLGCVDRLQQVFRTGLLGINERVQLRLPEIEFAAAGFGDVLQKWAYTLILAQAQRSSPPPFMQVYGEWLDSTVRVSTQAHRYFHADRLFSVQVVNYAYGRVGLRVQAADTTYYVSDGMYACPAAGYMALLLVDIAQQMAEAVTAH